MTDNDGEIIQDLVEREVEYVPDNAITLADVYEQMLDMNEKFNILIDTFRWAGKYDSIEKNVEAHTELGMYRFKFPVRRLTIDANQKIILRINDIGNSPITIDRSEMPYIIQDVFPNMVINTIYISTGSTDTMIKITAMG